ncbi:hypothetical protein [Ponticoccus alexandrii]|uniref:Tetratricopeptide repeat protein n=1 Tax=Ponticoccus alexandrii TaxID=1943633 RepID=A0ABX7FF15_9RHOB|nr:hypothetical protein [Ponticoccus alexandrii]ETA52720.1 hypothetical protein P279_07035 [Rhodobacteraceae bacterium PD-2]QRF68303.1 hypothetical protein GQA70_19485 [Ponticoccus alexandrii]
MRFALLILAWLLPGHLLAQTVSVRSGEHGAFTRLVFDIPPSLGWTLDRAPEERQVRLDLEVDGLGFDLTRVFDRINRDRLASIAQAEDGSSVILSLACACDVEAFVLGDRMLVLDIRALDPAEDVADKPAAGPPRLADRADATLAGDLSRVRVDGIPGIGPSRSADPLLPRLPTGKPPNSRKDAVAVGEPVRDMSDAVAIGDQIAADLAAAATEGILTAAVAPKPYFPASSSDQPVGRDAKGIPASSPDGDIVQQLAAGLSDVDHTAAGRRRIQVGGLHCISDESLRIARWVEPGTEINTVLAQRRGRVFGEFDRIDEAALETYAKTLLHFGFGAEARAAMNLSKADGFEVLKALSYLMDHRSDRRGLFGGQTNCPGGAALWSVIALPEEPGSHLVDTAAVLRGYESLPIHLREHLGPVLANRLSGAGYPDAARDVLNRLRRSKGRETDSIALGRAQLDLHQGDLGAAEVTLRSLATEGGPESPEAILASIELARAAGKPVPGYLVDLADAFTVEFRNSEEGPEFWKAHVTALLLNDAFQAAHDRISDADRTYLPEEVMGAMRNMAVEAVVERADDLTFLKLATRDLEENFRPARDRTVLAIAQRFLKTGLPDAALNQLAMIPSASAAGPEAAILRAKALLDLGRHEEAEIILIGRTGEDVTRIRAELRDRMGDHELAGSMYSALGEDALARQAAWLSGDWRSVADGSEDALAQAAALIQSPPDDIDVANPSLAAAEGLSNASVDTRDKIRALLEATQITGN